MGAIVTYDLTKKVNKCKFGTVIVNRIDNPFDPIGSKVTKTDIHGGTLDTYLEGYCLGRNLIVSVNKKVIYDDYSNYIVKPNDNITYTPILEGGGGGSKQILSIVAMIALVAVSGGLAASIMGATSGFVGAGVYGGLSGTIILGALQAGIVLAGSLLINAVLGTGSPKLTSSNIETESSTYSWGGIQTSRDLNTPIPVLYGTHMLGGTVINSRFYYNGSDDWISTQLALCHGEIEAISSADIKVNDNAFTSYIPDGTNTNGNYQYRIGTFDQSIMTGFSDSNYNNGNITKLLKYNIPYNFTSESTNIDYFRLHVEFPSGLYKINSKSGKKEIRTVILNAKYKKTGTSTWYPIYVNGSQNITFTASSSVSLKKFFEPLDQWGNPLVLEASQYEFSITRMTADDAEGDSYNYTEVHVRFLEEIQTADINYGGIALLGIDLKATDQLSNSRPNFITKVTRRPLFINNTWYDCTNPAWICLDVLTNKNYGMGLDITDIDLVTFNRWASFCSGGIANTFTLTRTIPTLVNNQHVLDGDLVIAHSALPNTNENLSLNNMLKGTSTGSFIGTRLVNNTSIDTNMGVNDIISINKVYLSGQPILADGWYFKVKFNFPLKTSSACTYSLVFKDYNYTVSPKLSFNGLFDTSSDIWTALQDIAQVGRGQVILRGNKYSCVYDDVKTVKGLYNAANSTNVTVQYLSNADIASEIEIQFSDKNIDYEMNSISVQDSAVMLSNVKSNKTTKQVKGLTSESEALVHGKYLLATSKFLRRMITLDADIESITQTVGDLIAVQTDVTQYGVGGLVLQKIGNSVVLDTIVELEYNKQYIFKIKNHLTDDIEDFIFTLTQNMTPSYTYNDSSGVALGVLTFGDFNLVVNSESNGYVYTNTLILSEGYEIYKDDRYSFGLNGSDSILCTIVDIDRSGDLTRKITAVEYNASILDFNYDNDMIQRLEPTGKIKNQISGFNASDRLVKLDAGQVVASVSFGWEGKVSSAYNIYLLEAGGFKHYLGNNIKETRYEYPNTVMIPETAYTIFIEDALDISITSSMVYTITSFSANPEDITEVQLTTSVDSINFNIVYPNKPLDFAYYNIYRNNTLISTQISDKFSLRHSQGSSLVQYSVEAVDMIKKKSNLTSQNFLPLLPSVTSIIANTEGENIKLSITTVKGSFDIDFYSITYDNTTVTSKDPIIYIKADYTGSKVFSAKVTDVLGNNSTLLTQTVNVLVPAPLNITASIDGKDAIVTWGAPTSGVTIDYYEVHYDSHVVNSTTNSFRVPITWGGTKTFTVYTVNKLGAKSSGVSTSITINPGSIVQLQTEVIDNNVLLRWSSLQGSLPVENFMLYKGPDENNLTAIGEKKGTFTTIFENESGTYTYWICTIDSAGNYGALRSATTKVSEPPDYVLNTNWLSTLNGTISNGKVDTAGLVLPINTTENIQTHFTSRGWTTPAQQVAAGNPLWIQPFVTSGYYEEVFDYGTILASSLVTVNVDREDVIGTPTMTVITSISTNGTTWVDYTDQTQVYGTGFRYVKVKLVVTGTNFGLRIKALEVKLDSKIRTDAGTGTSLAGDVGGTIVNFTKEFVDIISINVTPSGTTPLIAIYDFIDVPNPTSFKVLLYTTSGVRASGSFSWGVRGY